MSINAQRNACTITFDGLTFYASDYEISHDKRIIQLNAVKGTCELRNQGVNSFTLKLRGCFSKTDTDIAVTLESTFQKKLYFAFTLGDILFTAMTLKSYSFSEDIHRTFNQCELTFVCPYTFGGADDDGNT